MCFNRVTLERGQTYADHRGTKIIDVLDQGHDGTVFITTNQTVVKVHERVASYRVERDVYLRLRDKRITSLEGHQVPQLQGWHDALASLELSIVRRPYVLDFGKASLDVPPEHDWPEHVLSERWHHWEQQFEPEQWPQVLAIYGRLARLGVYLLDLHPGNIAFDYSTDAA